MSEILKIFVVTLVGVSVGTWLAMSYCAITKLGISRRKALGLAVDVMVQFPRLCLRIFNQKFRAPIKISKLGASDLDYIAVFPLEKASHSPIYEGAVIWEAWVEADIEDLLRKIKSPASGLPRDCYGIVHLKGGQRASWIYRQGKFTVSHAYSA